MSTSSPHEEEESSWEMEFPIPTPAPASWCTEGAKWPKRRHISHRALLHISARLTEAKSSLRVAPLTPHRCGISNDKTKRGDTRRDTAAPWYYELHFYTSFIITSKKPISSHMEPLLPGVYAQKTHNQNHINQIAEFHFCSCDTCGEKEKKSLWWF